MKLKDLNFIFLIFISSLIISCENDNDENNECIEYEIGYVASVNAPSSGNVNETINIEVNFGVFNGCGGFGKFIETENGNVRTIEVEAKPQNPKTPSYEIIVSQFCIIYLNNIDRH